MARKLRVQFPGAVYHVLNRGDRRELIFLCDQDRELFLQTLGETCARTGWQAHAWCLMPNHFHLVLETPRPNVVAGMKWFLGTYTSRFNRRHKLFGHLFSGRYKSLIIDASNRGYLKTACDYVHLNPVRARLLKSNAPLSTFRWSSYPEYLKPPGNRSPFLRVDRLLGEHGIRRDTEAGRNLFQTRMQARRHEDHPEEWKQIRRGWALGSESFRQELLDQMHSTAGPSHYGEELGLSDEEKASRILSEELRELNAPLHQMSKSDPRKLKIARRIRGETSVPLRWIAEHLHTGATGYTARLLASRQKAP